MTTEQILRDQLDRATRDVPPGPGVEACIASGRRRRARRRGVMSLAVLTVVGLGAAGLQAAMGTGTPTAADDRSVAGQPTSSAVEPPSTPAVAFPDYVTGTEVDTNLATVIADRLGALPDPDDVYPSDRNHAGPIPDAQWAQAEDWQATYTLTNGNQILVFTGTAGEGPNVCLRDCVEVPGGTLSHQVTSGDDAGLTRWYFGTFFGRADGSSVSAFEIVAADAEEDAARLRRLGDREMELLVQDPGLTFEALGAVAP